MSNVKVKYLKDEDGNIFSPVVNTNGIFTNSGGGICDLVYPVGSIYISVNSTNPANLFGGTWEQIKDRFLLSCGNTYTNGAIGGEATHTLTINEIPSHRHTVHGRTDRYQGSGTAFREPYSYNESGGTDNNIDTYATGGNQAHNNMPPYLAVYMWKRTA